MDYNSEQFGIHLMIDGYDADVNLLKDESTLTRLLTEIPLLMGMHMISSPVVVEVGEKNRKDPGGLSGFILIAESHISFHTFPRRGFVTIDMYTCQNSLDTDKMISEFTKRLKIGRVETYLQRRGISYPTDNIN